MPLKRMGINYVFDTTFSADLTIMEEGNEFVKRFTSGELKRPPDVHFLLSGMGALY